MAATVGDGGSPLGPVARALTAAARIAEAGDSGQIAAALAREACRISGADACTVHLLHCSEARILARYDRRLEDPARREAAVEDDGTPPHVRLALTHDDAELGHVELYWEITDPGSETAPLELIALRDLAAAHLGASLERDAQRNRLRALDDLTIALRQQVHEYANRMQVLSGLYELGDDAAAHRFLADMVDGHLRSPAAQVGLIDDPVVAGTLVALMRTARRRRIHLELDADSRLARLPSALNTLDLVTVVANTVGNALDAVTDQTDDRRRVHVSIIGTDVDLRLVVRDWGPGVDGLSLDELCAAGISTKNGHHGVGLALVKAIVEERRGTLTLGSTPAGVRLVVSLPWS